MNIFNNFLGKSLLKSQMKKAGVPQDQQDKMIKLVTENPELFQKIATEAQAKMKEGKDQQGAMMEVMQEHQAEIAEAMSK